jgi:hypothetical protein
VEQLRIAFIGRSQKANTLCARHLYWNYKFRFRGMDDELDSFLRHLYGWPSKRKKYLPWETRLKFYDAWQAIDPLIWAKRTIRRANDEQATYGIVIPDARYLAEIKYLEENGFIFIRVHSLVKPKIIKSTNKGAIAYYEWFARDADAYVHAKYSINHESIATTRKALDIIIKELTGDDYDSILNTEFLRNKNGGVKRGKKALGALNEGND